MKLAFISPRLPQNGAIGGAETLLLNLATLAADAGHEVVFLTTCARNHFTWANELSAGETSVGKVRVIRFPVIVQAGLFTVRSPELEKWLAENLAALDRVIAGPYLFGLTLASAKIAAEKMLLVPCLHDEEFARAPEIAEMFKNVRGIIFNTHPERELAERLFGPRKNSAVVGFALEDPSEKISAAKKLPPPTSSPYIIYSGRREPLKGTPLLFDYFAAFRKLTGRDIKLVLTGSGEVPRPDSAAAHIIDLGFVSEETKLAAMAGAVAFVHMSVNESLGIVLLESWLAGRPVLVHEKGVVLTDQTRRACGGLWFRDYPEFHESLLRLLDEPELAAELGARARAWTLATYSPAAVTERLIAVLKR